MDQNRGSSQIKTLYIDPGSPWQNGYIESFHSRLRDECLNREWLLNLREARVVIEDWRHVLRADSKTTPDSDIVLESGCENFQYSRFATASVDRCRAFERGYL